MLILQFIFIFFLPLISERLILKEETPHPIQQEHILFCDHLFHL